MDRSAGLSFQEQHPTQPGPALRSELMRSSWTLRRWKVERKSVPGIAYPHSLRTVYEHVMIIEPKILGWKPTIFRSVVGNFEIDLFGT